MNGAGGSFCLPWPSGRCYHARMAKAKRGAPRGQEDVSLLAMSIFDKVREIKRKNPTVSRNIDKLEREIRDRLESVRTQIARVSEQHDRDLVTILVINGLHRTADEVLIDR